MSDRTDALIEKAAQIIGHTHKRETETFGARDRRAARAVLKAVADDITRQAVADALAPIRALVDEWEGSGITTVQPSKVSRQASAGLRAAIERAEGQS